MFWKSLLKSKKFWTLISAIVAALSAFFLSSCTGYRLMQTHGVHHDTVKIEQYLKHKDFAQWKSSPIDPNLFYSLPFFVSTHVPGKQIVSMREERNGCFYSCSLTIPRMSLYSSEIPQVYSSGLIFPIVSSSSEIFSEAQVSSLSDWKLISSSCGIPSFLTCSLLMAFPLRRSRRGGRKSKPKTTKSVPLTGSHF